MTASKVPAGGEHADVKLVDNVIFERDAGPVLVVPGKLGIDDCRRAMHSLRLKTRSRIGSLVVRLRAERNKDRRAARPERSLHDSRACPFHRNEPVVSEQAHADPLVLGCPNSKSASVILQIDRADGSPCSAFSPCTRFSDRCSRRPEMRRLFSGPLHWRKTRSTAAARSAKAKSAVPWHDTGAASTSPMLPTPLPP